MNDHAEKLAETVRRDGYGLWPGLLSPTVLRRLQDRCHNLATSRHALAFPRSTRVWDLYRHGPELLGLLSNPALSALMTNLLGSHHLLSDYSLNTVHPRQPQDDWHIDYPYNEMTHLASGPIMGVQCVLPLDEFTARNGATHIVAGSHHTPQQPTPNPPHHHVVQAPAGTLIVMAAATWHRSGFNSTDAPRTAILLSYVERWIRPMTDPPEPGPWSATMPLRLLLGQERPPETINGVMISSVR
ncbi:MAG TPA: phytanoyl-CoA dioxygenase family protein [Actinocrinis sp.]|nr:phytanoyl-CoA dioxygenase family protein [Actinocrinis sp.]